MVDFVLGVIASVYAFGPRGVEENQRFDPWTPRRPGPRHPPDDVHKFEQTLKQLGQKVDIKICDDAGHAFENPNH